LEEIQTPIGNSTLSTNWYSEPEIDNAMYYIKKISQTGSYSEEYFDDAGRSIHMISRGFKGAKVHLTKSYNAKGLVSQVTEPSESASSPGDIINYTFDPYGRTSTVIGPGISLTYDYTTKRKIEVTDSLGNGDSYKVFNSLGEVIEANDNGGSITYKYNSIGKPIEITPPNGSTISMIYDLRGLQTDLSDPDAGHHSYEYDLRGQLTAQYNEITDSRYDLQYDDLGRIIEKSNSLEGITTYDYVTAGDGLGLIDVVSTGSISKDFDYNELGQITDLTETIEGIDYIYSYDYDSYGRISEMTYPGTTFGVQYKYETNGPDLLGVNDNSGAKIWEIEDANIKGQMEKVSYGNGLVTDYTYDDKDRPHEIVTQTASNVKRQHLEFNFNNNTGNLMWRKDHLAGTGGLQEDFTYDNLNRLLTWQVQGEEAYGVDYKTDGSGNFDYKTDIGSYNFEEIGNAGPHALTKINQDNGEEMIPNDTLDISYTKFDKISNISDNQYSLDYTYGIDNERKTTVLKENSNTLKKKIFVGDLLEIEIDDQDIARYLYYIPGISGEAAIFEVKDDGNNKLHYIHKDYLGSYHTITDEEGDIEETLSFDPWGRRRNATDWTYADVPADYLFDRGYTGHEHMDAFSFINMNGRVYDPVTALFINPDNFIQSPAFSLNFNRYSYCLNNPFKYIDPSGEKWWHWVLSALSPISYLQGVAENGSWNASSWDWDKAYFKIGATTNSDGNSTFYFGFGWKSNEILPAVGYNTDYGFGIGNANNSGNNNFYYPSINYDAPKANVDRSINAARNVYGDEWHAANGGDGGRGIIMGTSIDGTLALPFSGYTAEVGDLGTRENAREFISHGPAYGVEASLSFNLIFIVPNKGVEFNVDDFAGNSFNMTGGYGFVSAAYELNDKYLSPDLGNQYKVYVISVGFGFGGSTSDQRTTLRRLDLRIDRVYPTIKF